MIKKIRRTLLFPIISFFVLIALVALFIGYWISLANLQRSLISREEERVTGIHSITKAIIDTEVVKTSTVSRLLRKDRVLAETIKSKNKASLKRLMDELYKGLDIDYLTVADSQGMNIYSWTDTRDDLAEMWGMDEALDGKEITTTDRSPVGFIISIMGPVYNGKSLDGVVITGMKIDGAFAKRLADDTGSKIFFGSSSGVVAGSVTTNQIFPIDNEMVKHSLLDKKPIMIFNKESQTARLYAPVTVVDTYFCLIVDTNVSNMYLLLKQSMFRLMVSSVGVFLLVALFGSIVAVRIIKPLRRLTNNAESMVRDYSDETKTSSSSSRNEVDTLVYAFDHMVNTVRDHITARDRAYREVEKARGDLEERVKERTAELAKTNENLVQAEATARENERWLHTILESLQTGVMLIDAHTRKIIYANRAACALAGLAQDDLLESVCHKHICPAEVGRCPVLDLGQIVDNAERILLTAAGSQMPILKSVVPVSFKGQDLLLESFIDIRERKVLEQAMKTAKESAESANKAKSEFLAKMSHEIRTPMNGVLGFMRLLEAEHITEEQRSYVRMALTSGESLLGIINDILDVSKIEAGKMVLTSVDFDLGALVEEVVSFFGEQARQKGLELICHISSEGPFFLRGDMYRLRQIMVNLIGNAIKFTARGEVVIRVKTEEDGLGSALLTCSVTDTGIGINPDMHRSIFEAFSQEDGSTTRRFGGTGLGLTISRQLVEMMKGVVEVESTQNQGSTFRFTACLERQSIPAEHVVSKLKSLHVLVVVDNSTSREIICQQLNGWGVDGDTAEDGQMALEALRRSANEGHPYDVVIFDREMSGMNGLDLAFAIKADKKLAFARLAMIASADRSVTNEEVSRYGIELCLIKPVRQSHLYNGLLDFVKEAGFAAKGPAAVSPSLTQDRTFTGNILLVEDNPVNQQLERIMINHFGCTVEMANNGKEAVDKLLEKSFDLVFMDCQMPVMDGFEATRLIREREAAAEKGERMARANIIAVTAHAMEDDRERCLSNGMDDYLSKPFNMKELGDMLGRWLPAAKTEMEIKKEQREEGREKQQELVTEEAVLDQKMLDMIVGIQPGLLDKIVNVYLENSAGLVEEIRVTVSSADPVALMKASHALKSASANLGATSLAGICKELEMKGRANSIEGALPVVETLLAEYARVKVALGLELERRK